jgi:glyoxalase-like protein
VTSLDHLVVAAATLDDGLRWAQERLGVVVPAGGRHERFATHNRVLRLSEATYLEIIAIDPAAAPPGRPRWFGLDEPALRAALAAGPKLITWVAASDDVHRAAAASPLVPATIERLRRGALEWLITVPPDGALAEGGTMPPLIEWLSRPHPASTMPDLGFGLVALRIGHPEPARLQRAFDAIGLVRGVVSVGHANVPGLTAELSLPQGGCAQVCSAM